MDYNHTDFCDSLNEPERGVFDIINGYIAESCPEYRPFVKRAAKKNDADWTLHYRKKDAKTGKALCTLYSENGKLNVRVCFLSCMNREFLARQDEFSADFKNRVLRNMICCADKSCRSYGGNKPCPWRQNYWVKQRLVKTCPYPWVSLSELTENDAADIVRLLDMQAKHMTQSSKEIKGSGYSEGNSEKCGAVTVTALEKIDFAASAVQLSDYVKKPSSLEKYVKDYRFTLLGANSGLWYCVAEGQPHPGVSIPQGQYAAVTVTEPMKFSADRVWNYICEWLTREKIAICEAGIDAQSSSVFFTRFYMENGAEYMRACVPVKA